jgi:hypothetical protein
VCHPTAIQRPPCQTPLATTGTEPSLRAILFGGEELFAESKKIILGEENNSGEEILRREQKNSRREFFYSRQSNFKKFTFYLQTFFINLHLYKGYVEI